MVRMLAYGPMKRLFALLLAAPAFALAQEASKPPAKAPAKPPAAASTPIPSASKPAEPAPAAKTPMWEPFVTVLQPQKDFEVCTKMKKGETRRYHWKSESAVDFNIHYHRGKDVFYPVKRNAMRADGGSFTAKEADEYCWMWTAKAVKAKLDGRLENPKD